MIFTGSKYHMKDTLSAYCSQRIKLYLEGHSAIFNRLLDKRPLPLYQHTRVTGSNDLWKDTLQNSTESWWFVSGRTLWQRIAISLSNDLWEDTLPLYNCILVKWLLERHPTSIQLSLRQIAYGRILFQHSSDHSPNGLSARIFCQYTTDHPHIR